MTTKKKEGIVLDSSLSLSSNELSPLEYKEKLVFLLQPIIDATFPDTPPKRQIKIHSNRITFACPYCSDSMKNQYAKRGNFILDGKFANAFKCFNCDQFRTIQQFFKDFEGELDLDVIEHIAKTQVDFENFIQKKYDMSFLLDRKEIEEYSIPRETLKKVLGLQEVETHWVWGWLKKRLQFQKERFLYNADKNYLVILNLVDNDKVIGLQRRTFKGSNKYLTYKLSKLYEIFKIDKKVPDNIDVISSLFGIMELNFAQAITLFEGPFDSFMFKNSVAASGAHKAFPIEMPLRYWFDDDETGRRKSIQYIEKEQLVFLWDKFKRNYNIPYKIKDLNDLMIYFKENNIRPPLFDSYFSDDPLDVIDI